MGRAEGVRSGGDEHPRTPLAGGHISRHHCQQSSAQHQCAGATAASQVTASGSITFSVLAAFCFWLLPASNAKAEAADKPAPDKSGYNVFRPTPSDMMRELSADRPDKTDCPFTVDAGHFQVEMDFANLTYDRANSSRNNTRFTAYEVAPMNLKVGLLNSLDFQLVYTPFRWERTDDRDTRTIEHKSGFEGITPRFKLNLVGNDGGFFVLALIPFVKLPLTQQHIGNGFIEGGLGIPYAF